MQPHNGDHDGIVYKGASGDLWFLRDDWDKPRKIQHAQLKTLISSHMQQSGQPFADRFPQDILDILNGLFGPLIGAWCVWGPRI